jgi:phage terminase large subunit-like protein
MLDEGFEMVEIRPTVLNFSEPMKKLGELVLQGKFHHNGDPVLAWMIGNVVFHRDHKDNIYPNKPSPEKKIDGVIALIMALARMSQGEAQKDLSD